MKEENNGVLSIDALGLVHADLVGMRIDATLAPGDFLVVVGRNGAGKSTLLQTVMGLQTARSGSVTLGGESVEAMSPRERASIMALVTSTPPRHAGITVRETLLLGLRAGGRSHRAKVADADVVEADMQQAGISDWANRRLDALSDGMAQRVMVARAAIQSRQVLVLDEPTAFLDVIGKEDVLLQLNRLRAEGRTVILSTHDLAAVAATGEVSHWLHLHPGKGEGSTLHEGGFDAEVVRSALRETGP